MIIQAVCGYIWLRAKNLVVSPWIIKSVPSFHSFNRLSAIEMHVKENAHSADNSMNKPIYGPWAKAS